MPLLLNKCVERVPASESVVVHEPLPQLLYCIVQCLDLYRKKFANATPEPGAAAGVMMRDMTVLTERMLKSELEDFELDKSSDYSESLQVDIPHYLAYHDQLHVQGQYNRCAAHMLLGVYQVLMNFVLFEPKQEQYQQAVKLFAHTQKLQVVLKEGGALPKAKVTMCLYLLALLSFI